MATARCFNVGSTIPAGGSGGGADIVEPIVADVADAGKWWTTFDDCVCNVLRLDWVVIVEGGGGGAPLVDCLK